ncbi:MAG: TIGR02530 family flagellar biosynthesis protein [candidate division Zixibacteria bacterium]|nr:TIGR02530 family flagellar biosynthesis protein [candidate division Zixibacteria bacterium]
MSESKAVNINSRQQPVNLIEIAKRTKPAGGNKEPGETSFKDMFSRELVDSRNITFSKHAQERLFSRGMNLTEDKIAQLADAINKAEAKGSRETLVLADDNAYVVSVKNRTVITVFDRDNLREGVVTAIDSAVIV